MYEFTCTYLCGNKNIDKDAVNPKKSERCDIGEWGFSKLDKDGYYSYADPTASVSKSDAFTWIDDKSDPKVST